MMSRGRIGGIPRSSVALLYGSGSSLLRPRGSHPSLGEGSDQVMSLKSCGMGEGPTGPH
jgi:hypothetical protein